MAIILIPYNNSYHILITHSGQKSFSVASDVCSGERVESVRSDVSLEFRVKSIDAQCLVFLRGKGAVRYGREKE